MIASLKGYGRIARTVLAILGGLLLLGIVGSFIMSIRAGDQAREAVVAQASTLADSSLSLAFSPEDLSQPVDPTRAVELAGQVQSIVIDPSEFTDVTLFTPEGTVLYSTKQSLIGTQMPGERERIKEALRGVPQTKESDGTISVLVPMTLRSGVGEPAAVELTRPDDPIASAPGPWRTNAMFLFAMLVLLAVAVFGVARVLSVVTDTDGQPQPQIQPAPQAPMRQLTPPLAGMREESEARRRAEDRARAAEERLNLLQEQYRKALEDLQTYQHQPRAPQVVSDPRIEERALRAEGQLATLQQQVQTLAAERQQLAQELEEQLRRQPDGGDTELLLRASERESQTLRHELAEAQAQLLLTEAELATTERSTGETILILRPELEASQVEAMRSKDALASSQGELERARRELDDARAELRALRNEEQRAAMLEDELRAAKAEIESARASQRAELVEREADFEDKVRTTREEFQRELASLETSYRTQVAQKEAELADRIDDRGGGGGEGRDRPRDRALRDGGRAGRGGEPRAAPARGRRRDDRQADGDHRAPGADRGIGTWRWRGPARRPTTSSAPSCPCRRISRAPTGRSARSKASSPRRRPARPRPRRRSRSHDASGSPRSSARTSSRRCWRERPPRTRS